MEIMADVIMTSSSWGWGLWGVWSCVCVSVCVWWSWLSSGTPVGVGVGEWPAVTAVCLFAVALISISSPVLPPFWFPLPPTLSLIFPRLLALQRRVGLAQRGGAVQVVWAEAPDLCHPQDCLPLRLHPPGGHLSEVRSGGFLVCVGCESLPPFRVLVVGAVWWAFLEATVNREISTPPSFGRLRLLCWHRLVGVLGSHG